ncbi:MAG: hypothetical protein KC438_01585 [Thermomicrobiales bacterium]|nr:hypothetical protein [Thermomicrobiales bacterium]MCO5222664.1 hypothetical protein [Thermomicrobiales bacterium]
MPIPGRPANPSKSWSRQLERFIFVMLLALGAMTIVSTSWASDVSTPRATLLGSQRGISVLVTSGPARVLIVNGTDPAALGNAISGARHPGLDRIDLLIVSGNGAASELAARTIALLRPRAVMTVGSASSLTGTGVIPRKIIDRATEIELPNGVLITIDIWLAADGENDDVTWSATIERGGATIYWVADREALIQDTAPESVDVTVIGRAGPGSKTVLPTSRVLVAAGESIAGPELRTVALDAIGLEVETARVFAGETIRIDLDPEGIRTIPGANPATLPEND